jgi:hypothetical protein
LHCPSELLVVVSIRSEPDVGTVLPVDVLFVNVAVALCELPPWLSSTQTLYAP